MDNDKVVHILSKRIDDLSKNQELMRVNKAFSDDIFVKCINDQTKTIKYLKFDIGVLALVIGFSGIIYLSHELKQDKKLENLHKSGSKMCSKTCILHKSENENDDIFDVDDLK